MKPGSKATAIVLLFIGLVLINYLASSTPWRVDATAESIYSLSPGTEAMLGKIEEPITLDLYFSQDASGLPISYKNYATRVEEMLRQYVRASGGRLVLNTINPRPDTPEEERAVAAGISPQISQRGGEQFFFGLVVTQADQQKNLPAFTPQREPFLEYDLSKLIHTVQRFEKPKLGLLTSLPLKGASPQEMQMAMMMRRPPTPGQFVVSEWEQSFTIVPVEPTATELPTGLDALAVIHPQNLSDKLQFSIDQFLLAGKPVFLAVDPASQYFKRQGGQQAMFSGGPQPNVSSDLATLLNAYGLSYDARKIVGDLENGTDLQNPQTRQVSRYPTWLNLRKEFLSPKAQPTASLNSLLFVEAGAFAAKPDAALTFAPLIETSAQSGTADGTMLQFAGADELNRQIAPSGKKTIAALVTGKFKTAFPNGAPKDTPAPANTDKKEDAAAPAPAIPPPAQSAPQDSLKESATSSTLFVIADTDWLFDDYSVEKYNFLGQTAVQPLNDNLAFAANTLEFLGGSQDLISIRGKGSSLRPFTVVRAMEIEAQKKYQQKLTRLETQLQEVQTKLSELQGKKTEGNRLVATPEMTKAIEDFRKQQARLSGERRDIRRALREDIDSLENRLLILNLLSTPLIVGVFGFWFYRARRR
jgi:ABC-type uncharacterized transport system involved in gliding motility auxiliary subunit